MVAEDKPVKPKSPTKIRVSESDKKPEPAIKEALFSKKPSSPTKQAAPEKPGCTKQAPPVLPVAPVKPASPVKSSPVKQPKTLSQLSTQVSIDKDGD